MFYKGVGPKSFVAFLRSLPKSSSIYRYFWLQRRGRSQRTSPPQPPLSRRRSLASNIHCLKNIPCLKRHSARDASSSCRSHPNARHSAQAPCFVLPRYCSCRGSRRSTRFLPRKAARVQRRARAPRAESAHAHVSLRNGTARAAQRRRLQRPAAPAHRWRRRFRRRSTAERMVSSCRLRGARLGAAGAVQRQQQRGTVREAGVGRVTAAGGVPLVRAAQPRSHNRARDGRGPGPAQHLHLCIFPPSFCYGLQQSWSPASCCARSCRAVLTQTAGGAGHCPLNVRSRRLQQQLHLHAAGLAAAALPNARSCSSKRPNRSHRERS